VYVCTYVIHQLLPLYSLRFVIPARVCLASLVPFSPFPYRYPSRYLYCVITLLHYVCTIFVLRSHPFELSNLIKNIKNNINKFMYIRFFQRLNKNFLVHFASVPIFSPRVCMYVCNTPATLYNIQFMFCHPCSCVPCFACALLSLSLSLSK
jgi:hypothetical protein